MKRKPYLGVGIALAVAGFCSPGLALDDSTRAAARNLVNEGVAHYRANRYAEAQRKFLEAYAVAKVPTVAVWAGQAHEKLGQWVVAAEYYENALLMQPNELWVGNAQQQAQLQAEELLRALKPRVPKLTIQLVGNDTSGVEVMLDGTTIPNAIRSVERPVDPGKHEITVSRGGQTNQLVVSVAEAESKSVSLEVPVTVAPPKLVRANVLKPSSTPMSTRSSPIQRTLGWTSIAVGAVGLTTGVTAGIVVGVKRSSLHDDGCKGNVCNGGAYSNQVDSYNAWRTISTVGFVAGGIGLGLGVTLLLTSPRSEAPEPLAVVMSPNALGVKGAF